MVLYQYLKGNLSPAGWFEEAKRNEAMQWLGRGYEPARRTWYDFRDRAGQFIEQLHKQIVERALELGLDPTIGVQDGTMVAACASRHRMVNRVTLEKRREQLDAILDGKPPDELPKWVPPTDSGRRDLAERMSQAAEVLAERIANNAAKKSGKRRDPAKIQVSLSDPVAPLGRDKLKVFRPLYTVQYMVAPGSHVVMAYCCEASVTDVGTLAPMIDKTRQFVGERLKTVLADAAYCTILDLRECIQRNINLLAPVQSNGLSETKKKTNPKSRFHVPNSPGTPPRKTIDVRKVTFSITSTGLASSVTANNNFGSTGIVAIRRIAAVAHWPASVFDLAPSVERSNVWRAKNCSTRNGKRWRSRKTRLATNCAAKPSSSPSPTTKTIDDSNVSTDAA